MLFYKRFNWSRSVRKIRPRCEADHRVGLYEQLEEYDKARERYELHPGPP
jgi:hypothetical protein